MITRQYFASGICYDRDGFEYAKRWITFSTKSWFPKSVGVLVEEIKSNFIQNSNAKNGDNLKNENIIITAFNRI